MCFLHPPGTIRPYIHIPSAGSRYGITLALLLLFAATADPSTARQREVADLDTLIEQLESTSPEVRARAACRLEDLEYRARRAAPALLALLGDDARLPHDICDGVGGRRSWQDRDCTEDAESCFTTPGEKAARALTDTGPLDVSAVKAVLSSGAEHARRNAAWLLGATDQEDAVNDLIAATGDEAAVVRELAVWAIGAIGNEAAADRLEGILDDPSPHVRENAAWALGALGSGRAVPTLEKLTRDADSDVVENAAWALGAVGDRRGVPALIALLEHAHPDVRENAAWALGAIGDESAVDALIELFQKDDNNDVRRKAMWALTAIK